MVGQEEYIAESRRPETKFDRLAATWQRPGCGVQAWNVSKSTRSSATNDEMPSLYPPLSIRPTELLRWAWKFSEFERRLLCRLPEHAKRKGQSLGERCEKVSRPKWSWDWLIRRNPGHWQLKGDLPTELRCIDDVYGYRRIYISKACSMWRLRNSVDFGRLKINSG